MNSKTVCFRKSAMAAVLVLLGTQSHAASGAWNGIQDANWVNSANWSVAPYPSGGETATFNTAGGVTALDLAGLSGILNITFDTASVGAYTLGAGAANSQTLVMGDGGTFRLNSGAANSQTFNSAVQLGQNTTASYSFRNDAAGPTLTFNNVSGSSGGTKTLNFDGSGSHSVLGNLAKSGSTLNVTVNGTGALTLSGSNNQINQLQINGAGAVINLAAGTTTTFNNGGGGNLMAAQDCTINGPGSIVLSTAGGEAYADNGAETGKTLTINARLTGNNGFEYWHGTYRGTIALRGINDFTQNVIMNVPGTISCTNIGPKNVAGNLGAGTTIIHNGANARLLYVGAGDTTDRTVNMRADGIVEQGGTGTLKFTDPVTVSSGTKTLTLQGSTAGIGEFSGAIRNDQGLINLKKEGSGVWSLSAANPYTGTTAVNGGTLALSGTAGAITASSGITLAPGATLLLNNTASANNADRLGNAVPLTLNSATLSFSNDGGAASTSESAGPLIVNVGASTVATSQAASGQTATLTFASLSTAGGNVNFTGSGLGENDQNRIFITGQPDGLIGVWATVNGSSYAGYSSTRGVYAETVASTSIAARGPDSVIPDDAAAAVHITTAGDAGDITLAGSTENSVFTLQQDTVTDATVATLNKTLKAAQVQISSGQANLTIGAAQGDGALAALMPGGRLTLANDDGASVLTVNAAVANNTSASSLAKTGPGKVLVNGPLNYTGSTGIGAGTLAFGGSLNQTLASVISGFGALAKEGTGRLTLSAANTYTGLTVVSEGVLVAQNSAALGASTGGTVIEDGATLDLGGTLAAQALNLNAEQITVSGAGVNGRGAVINSSNTSQYNALRLMTLAGNTTFGGDQGGGRWDLRNASGTSTLAMNGFNITKVGANQVGLTGVAVTPGAGNIDIQQGNFTIEVGSTLGGSAANVMTVQGGATFDLYQIYTPIIWSLALNNNARFYTRSGNVTNQNIWAGPVTLNGQAIFDGAGSTMDTITGDISGTGPLVKTGVGSITRLAGGSNAYSGGTVVSNGMLYVLKTGTLPGYEAGAVTVTGGDTFGGGGILAVPAGDGTKGWALSQIKALHDASLFTAADASLGIDTDGANLAYPYAFRVPMGLTKMGTGTLTIPENQSLQSQLRVKGGELILHNIVNNSANRDCLIGDLPADFGRLTVSGNTELGSFLPGKDAGNWQALIVGNAGKGVVVLKDDASVTNKLIVGNAVTGAGAVYQSGNSRMHNWGGGQNDGRIGMAGYGYYELNGGTFTNNGYFQVGHGGPNNNTWSGVGILRQTGGAFEQGTVYGGQFGLSRGGTGVVYAAGGTFITATGINVGESSDNGTTRGYAEFTVDGGDVNVNGNVSMADRTSMFAAVNLNGGTLTANQISKVNNRAGALALVNFDGGTFRSRAAGNIFNTGTSAPDAVNIYAGGATFDTTNLLGTIAVPLRAPPGSGVSSIAVTPTAGYIGPPMVTITDGGGTGATAIAQFDSASGTVNGILVTCPGFGYTSAPTVRLSGGGASTQATVGTVTLAPNVSGGLTKVGSGMLTLSATNTYAGATTVSNGILRAGIAEALPAGTGIVLAGGTLDLGGFSLTNGAITATGGAIINGTLACDSLTKTGTETLLLGAQFATPAPIIIHDGVVKLPGAQAGLYEGVLAGNFNTADPNPNTGTALTTVKANTTANWTDNTTAIYSGYLWNRAETNVTWTFAEQFDDNVYLRIDSTVMIANGASWNVPTIASITLAPGAHTFEARFGQGGGGAGPVNADWWTTTAFGFGVDTLGRNENVIGNYQPLADPGDGSLLTLTAAGGNRTNLFDAAASVVLGPNAVLDLDTYCQTFASVSGSGIISNGTLAVSGAIMPGGVSAIGTLTLAASAGLSGTLLADVAANGESDRLAVQGNVDLSSLALAIANPAQLDHAKQYTLLTCSGTRTGAFASVTVPDSHWHAVYQSDGTVKLVYVNGTLIRLR